MNTLYDAEDWFLNADFDLMEEISPHRRDDFPDGSCGDGDFIDAVDRWWQRRLDEEKIDIYSQYQ